MAAENLGTTGVFSFSEFAETPLYSRYMPYFMERLEKSSHVVMLENMTWLSTKSTKKAAVKYERTDKKHSCRNDIWSVLLRGNEGTELAKALLSRGINVIQEQPIHFKDVEECAKLTRKNVLYYHVGDLYKSLKNVSCFIEAAKRISEVSEPICMDIGCASQVSYPVFEIVSEVLKTCRLFTMETVTENNQPYQLASVKIGGIPVHFTVQNQVNPDDPDNFMHYLFKLELITVHGRLRLDDVMGGV